MRLTFTFLLLLSFIFCSAQHQGDVYLSGATHLELGYEGRGVTGSTGMSGIFLFDRLLVGAEVRLRPDPGLAPFDRDYRINPFVRYYLPGDGPLTFFGQAGIATISGRAYGESNVVKTDFALGAGAEYRLAPGLAATGLLRYRINELGINTLDLDLSLNALGRQGFSNTVPAAYQRGDWLLGARLGNISFGTSGDRREFTADLDFDVSRFVTDRLAVEFAASYSRQRGTYGDQPETNGTIYTDLRLSLGGSYFLGRGRLRPYLHAGAFLKKNWIRFESESTSGVREFTATDREWGITTAAGLQYFLNDRALLDLRIGSDNRIGTRGSQLTARLGVKFRF